MIDNNLPIELKSLPISIADDDDDDRLLIEEAFAESNLSNPLFFVKDGEELLDYLYRRGGDKAEFPLPSLILLDLNMPKKDGREALQEIKSDPNLKRIPVVVLTTSQEQEDILRSYCFGGKLIHHQTRFLQATG